MAKKMTLSNLQSQVNREYKPRKLILDGYEVLIEDKFKPTKIQQLIQELIGKSEYAEQNGLLFNIIDYSYILLIKYFTDVKVPNEYENQIQIMQTLFDLNYIEKIISEFNQDEVNKITNMLKNSVNNTTKLLEGLQGLIENAEL